MTANYEITYANGTLTVSKRAVTVKADDKEKIIGTGDPELTATVTGFIGADTVAYTLSREAGEDEGIYTITPSGDGELENYTVTYLPGRLTISEIPTYDVTVIGGEGDGSFTQGESVTVIADSPAPGFVFERWTGDVDFDDETSPAATFEMPALDVTVTAVFRDAASLDERFDGVDVSRGGSLDKFKVTAAFVKGAYSDVSANAWYSEVLKTAVEYGIFKGKGDGTFGVGQPMKLSEALAIVDRLHNVYYGGSGRFDQTKDEHWYTVYEDYAVKYGIIKKGEYDLNAPATRAQFALLLSAALPDGAFEPVNKVTALPDVAADDPRLPAILRLYNAGILTGMDGNGSFAPNAPILREQSAAIVARVIVPALRVTLAK